MMVAGVEWDQHMARSREFQESKPWTFDGEKPDHWVFEKWILHMKKLFHDTYVSDGDRVWLATHHLERTFGSTDLAVITWPRCKEMLAIGYFPASVKRQMEMHLRNLQHGHKTSGIQEGIDSFAKLSRTR